VIALLTAVLLSAAPAPEARFEAANGAYLAGDLEAAARGYQALLGEGWESPALHLNLGNARLRMGQRGAAVASYARALRLDPGDEDARANLEAARKDLDPAAAIEARPVLLRLADRVPDPLVLALFALGWVGLWAGLAARRLAPGTARGAVAAATLAAGLAAAVGGGLLAGKVAVRAAPLAVVVVPSAPVREGAESALQPTLELHEGTAVRVLERRGAAVRVRLGTGLEGWLAASDLEAV
jgi:tetratricopeptide (TPR) repeat protein